MNMIFVLHNIYASNGYLQPAEYFRLSGPLNTIFWDVSIYHAIESEKIVDFEYRCFQV